jgi:deoxyadenosine/deoxycytidine kinase
MFLKNGPTGPPTSEDEEPRSLSNEWITAILVGTKKQRNKEISAKPAKLEHALLLLGLLLGAIAPDLMEKGLANLSSVDVGTNILMGVVGLVFIHKFIAPVLRPNQTDPPYPWWWILALGVAAGYIGQLLASRAQNPDLLKKYLLEAAAPIVISGGIGSGKAPLLKHLKTLGFPVSEISRDGAPLLERFWTGGAHMKEHAFEIQVWMLAQSLKKERQAIKEDSRIIFLNGSWREDIWCHSRALRHYGDGILSSINWSSLQSIGRSLMEMMPSPLMVVYLTCEPRTLLRRIRKHSSTSEESVTLDYLDTLSAYYGELMSNLKGKTYVLNIPVDDADFYEETTGIDEAVELIVRGFQLIRVLAWRLSLNH